MKYKAIIFDMDGTIIDTEHIWKEATNSLISKRGIILTPQAQAQLHAKLAGKGTLDCCAIIKETTGLPDEIADLAKEKTIIANQLYKKDLKFIEGFLEFHAQVIAADIKIGLATNADDHTLNISIDVLKLEKLFGVHIYNISHVGKVYKPNPAIYLHAAQQLGIAPEYCIAIEDSPSGIKAAKDAGMYCVGINTSKQPERLSESHHIIDRYDQIILEELLKRK